MGIKKNKHWVNKICCFSVLNRACVRPYISTTWGTFGVPTPSREDRVLTQRATQDKRTRPIWFLYAQTLSSLALFCLALLCFQIKETIATATTKMDPWLLSSCKQLEPAVKTRSRMESAGKSPEATKQSCIYIYPQLLVAHKNIPTENIIRQKRLDPSNCCTFSPPWLHQSRQSFIRTLIVHFW